MITDGFFALCSTRIFLLFGKLIACSARLVYSVAIRCIRLVQRTEPGFADSRSGRNFYTCWPRNVLEGNLGCPRLQIHSRARSCLRSAIATRSQDCKLPQVLHLRLPTCSYPLLVAARVTGLFIVDSAQGPQLLLGRTWRRAPTPAHSRLKAWPLPLPTTLHRRHPFIHSYRLPLNPTLLLRQFLYRARSSCTFLARAITYTTEADARHHVVGR